MSELEVGDRILHYIDDIEGYRMFEIEAIEPSGRYALKGLDTTTNLCRYLDNNVCDRRFNYMKVDDYE